MNVMVYRNVYLQRSTAQETRAFLKATKKVVSRSGKQYNETYWREYKKLFHAYESYYGKREGLRKLEEKETKNIERYVKGLKLT